jgi:hypothetical protein
MPKQRWPHSFVQLPKSARFKVLKVARLEEEGEPNGY